ncbi:MAG TPA: formyltransferase family protein [Thermoanaerobaculia bacterium]
MLTNVEPLRIAVLCSRRAPGLDALLADPQRGRLFDIACVVTSENEFPDRTRIERSGIPVLIHPIRQFVAARRVSLRDLAARRAYERYTIDVLRHENIDVIVLLGYLYVLTDVMLGEFPGRVLNVHDSDLTLTDGNGERRYVGLRSTLDAIKAGEAETRSSVHVVTEKLDGGPILFRSGPYEVAPFAQQAAAWGASDIVKAYAYAHREWMMRDSWGALVIQALESLAAEFEEENPTEATAAVTA